MTTTAPIRRIALLTAGGFAPCLSAAVAGLVRRYSAVLPDAEIIAYQYGYHGLLTGTFEVIGADARAAIDVLDNFGGSPIGNSRVKLTNAKNLVERGLRSEEHTSELQSRGHLVCRLLLAKKKIPRQREASADPSPLAARRPTVR